MTEAIQIIPDQQVATGRTRRDIASRRSALCAGMVRFVVSPDRVVLPDLEGTLPGRGFWLNARADVLNKAAEKNLFAKAARAPVKVDPALATIVERLLVRRCLDLLGLAKRAGEAVFGFDRVRAELAAGNGAVLVAASDGSADGRGKLAALGRRCPRVEAFDASQIGAAAGRGATIHAVLRRGRLADRLLTEARRLEGFRPGSLIEAPGDAKHSDLRDHPDL
ncbi:RNA-binding protein [Marinivivus vitaminiproducens]|uniref:RNA-binding protein n=1 Tax=Marinivivus vitaminiproducens TaxID=3035935 RepID=UPI00279E59D0|nr:RNA-binding protein [Geminicoccaceae bacterium SCSIO 64248]